MEAKGVRVPLSDASVSPNVSESRRPTTRLLPQVQVESKGVGRLDMQAPPYLT
jgi:hypothetical protein